MPTEPWSRAEFERRLRAKESGYHTHHPYHLMMNEGKLTAAQIRGWVANRFYYQFSIPMKDGAVLSNCPDREVRRLWIQRIVRFAVDAYVNFARTRPWQEAACSSLTELFAPQAHNDRLATWPHHYRWIKPEGLEYFRSRISQARRDVEHALTITLDYFTTREMQERALDILQFKLDILWALLDAVQAAYR